jgi:hypothetical protein
MDKGIFKSDPFELEKVKKRNRIEQISYFKGSHRDMDAILRVGAPVG